MTKDKKIRVAVLFGGKSAEHEVSIQSARNVVASLDKNKYDVVLTGIDKAGNWHVLSDTILLEASYKDQIHAGGDNEVRLVSYNNSSVLVGVSENTLQERVDVVFPVLHGPYGEDGSMQGLLKLADVPFVGSGVLGSAIGMDKDVSKRLLRDAGLPVANFRVYHKGEDVTFSEVSEKLGLPFFVKPANLGSSVGVNKIKTEKDFEKAVEEAFTYDTKIVLEEGIAGKEIECSVLGNRDVQASIPGEIVANHEFYDYDAKYLDEKGAELKIPADLTPERVKEVQDMACKVFKVLCLDGMARIDFFFTPDGKFYVNEANTIPGFTNISMYPKLWEASGMSYSTLIDRLIELAIEKYNEQHVLKTSL